MILSRFLALLLIALCFSSAASSPAATPGLAPDQYAGTTPWDEASRAFIGGISSDVPCHSITWRLTFSTNLNSDRRPTFRLLAHYGLQGKTDTNQVEDGPVVEIAGEWETSHGSKANPKAVVYRLSRPGNQQSVSLVRVGENLLHFLGQDKSLHVGNGGWSYTLNRLGNYPVTPLSAQIIHPAEANASTNFWKESPRQGPHIYGYFEGRSPCREIATLLNVPKSSDCIKIKWQLILYHDPVTHAPTTYALGGLAWRNPPKTGKWTLLKGTRENPAAVVCQLDPDNPGAFLSFLKADDNHLFFLGNNRALMVGNENFSYTLNRPPAK